MGEHQTWFHLLPGYDNWTRFLAPYLARTEPIPGLGASYFTIAHMAISLFVVALITLGALRYAAALRRAGDDRVIPEKKFGIRNLFEPIIEVVLSLAEGIMGRRQAERFLPFIGAIVFFILFNNLIGLVPGFLSPTDTLKTNLALSGMVLLVTQGVGLWDKKFGHLKHFLGPIWWLSWLILPIELFSQLVVRPLSLAIRLMGNMFADHKLLTTIAVLAPLLVPLPLYLLGILVSVVQTLIFSLLAMIYIAEAVAHEAH